MEPGKLKQKADIIPIPLIRGGTGVEVIRLVKKRVDEKTDYLLSGLSFNIANALFEEMNHLQKQDALNHHFNIMRAMKVNEDCYRDRFDELIGRVWERFSTRMDDSNIEFPGGQIGEMIQIYTAKTRSHYKILLHETGLRFQTLLGRDIDKHPLHPDLYYRCFWQSLAELDLSYEERFYVLPLFHRFVMNRYGQVLGLANRTLMEFKVDKTFIMLPCIAKLSR